MVSKKIYIYADRETYNDPQHPLHAIMPLLRELRDKLLLVGFEVEHCEELERIQITTEYNDVYVRLEKNVVYLVDNWEKESRHFIDLVVSTYGRLLFLGERPT